MSDIFGACVDHLIYGKSKESTFDVGEDIAIMAGSVLRNMEDPASAGGVDFYVIDLQVSQELRRTFVHAFNRSNKDLSFVYFL
jgi:Zn-dependent metalloprotease